MREALEGSDPAMTSAYEGFNLLYGPLHALRYHNNVQPVDEELPSGVHALSNHYLNTPWPKVRRAIVGMDRLVAGPTSDLVDGLFALLADDHVAPDDQLPDTGLPLPLERAASPIFIRSEGYGTRCSTVLLVSDDGAVRFEERVFPEGSNMVGEFRIGT